MDQYLLIQKIFLPTDPVLIQKFFRSLYKFIKDSTDPPTDPSKKFVTDPPTDPEAQFRSGSVDQ